MNYFELKAIIEKVRDEIKLPGEGSHSFNVNLGIDKMAAYLLIALCEQDELWEGTKAV